MVTECDYGGFLEEMMDGEERNVSSQNVGYLSCVGLQQFWSVLVVLENLAEIAHQNMPTQNLTTEYDWAWRRYYI